ncbi:hypothetical protein FACS189474_0210 [Bacteroidia bacterium]|nr:hypothetical protein FACS189474_0210 [Bacteroidia bacterium]
MKQKIFLMLTLLIWSAASMNAQVTIGSDAEPHAGAILDLESYSKGLKLPNVSLSNVDDFELVTGADAATKLSATGIVVYNTNDGIVNGQGRGIYVWDGVTDSWSFAGIGSPVAVPVSTISITGVANVTSGLTSNYSFSIQPANATNQHANWTVVPGTGTGSITPAGVFTAGNNGTVILRATAADGSGVYGEKPVTVDAVVKKIEKIELAVAGSTTFGSTETKQINATITPSDANNQTLSWTISAGSPASAATVNASGLVTGVSAGTVTVRATATDGSGIYGEIGLTLTQSTSAGPEVGGMQTYCYPGTVGCWTIDNSKLGTYAATTYSGHSAGERGYYYTWANASTACPTDWHLPNADEWNALKNYINGASATTAEKNQWMSGSALAGSYYTSDSSWYSWGSYGRWWSSGATNQRFYASTSSVNGPGTDASYYFSVRCVKN